MVERASISRRITESDVQMFSEVTGDVNPVHMDEDFSKRTIFGGRVVHGMLLGGLISAVLGTKLPGPGAIYLSQTMKFVAPVRIGDTVMATVEVIELMEREDKPPRVRLRTVCTNQDGRQVLEGEALLQLSKVD